MTYRLVAYSQQDPQWRSDILGFGEQGDTIGYLGCALASVAMLLSGHGFPETPKTLNEKLKKVYGFVGAGIRWGAVTELHSQVTLKAFIPCPNSDAPLAQIDASLAAGQPAIVMVDSSPSSGVQTHWVVIYAKKGDDYLMLDPWPYPPDPTTRETFLMVRYSHGKSLQRTIMHVILYENALASGDVETPSGVITPRPVPSTLPQARVKPDVIWGLNIRTSSNTSSASNILETVPAGTVLTILEPAGETKIGAVNQWIRVRTPSGKEGVAAAWYMEAVQIPAPIPETPPPAPEPSPVPTTPPPVDPNERLKVVVSSTVGAPGLPVYTARSTGSRVLSVQPAGSILACIEPYYEALARVGVAGEWLSVRYDLGRFGYIQADYVVANNPVPAPAPEPPPSPGTPPPAPADPNERLKVVVIPGVGSQGLPVYAYDSTRAKVVSIQGVGAILACLDLYAVARAKAGVKGEWLHIRYDAGKFGYVQAEYVQAVA